VFSENNEVGFEGGNTEAARRESGVNLMDCFLEETMSTLRVARVRMDTQIVGKENCVERRIDDFGEAINDDQEEGTAEWKALRNTIFLVVGGEVVTGFSHTKGAFLMIILE